MPKPEGIKNTALLMILILVVDTILSFMTPVPQLPGKFNNPAFLLSARLTGVLFTLLVAGFVYFYYEGKNWARWLVMIDSVICLLGIIRVHKTWLAYHPVAIMAVIKFGLAIYLLWYLNTPEIKAWFSPPPAYPPYPQPPEPPAPPTYLA